jgi:hypothetical protein
MTLFQQTLISGWWPVASAAAATSLTNVIAWAKSTRTKVFDELVTAPFPAGQALQSLPRPWCRPALAWSLLPRGRDCHRRRRVELPASRQPPAASRPATTRSFLGRTFDIGAPATLTSNRVRSGLVRVHVGGLPRP